MSTENKLFAKRIKELREEWGITQQQMAEMVGLRKTAISNYETGYTTPKIETLRNFMAVFNKPSSYFFEDMDVKIKLKAHSIYGSAIHYYKPTNIKGLRSKEPSLMDSTLTLPVQQHVAKNRYIATSISDNSMNLCGIKKDSCIVINTERKIPSDGQIFAAIRNGELIVRKYHRNDEEIYMSAESTRIPKGLSTESIPETDFEILGTVDKLIVNL